MDKKISIRINEETHERLMVLSLAAGVTLSTVARSLIENPRTTHEEKGASADLLEGVTDLLLAQQDQLEEVGKAYENIEKHLDLVAKNLMYLTKSVNKLLGAKAVAAGDVMGKMAVIEKRQDWSAEVGPGGQVGRLLKDGVVVLKSDDDQAMILIKPDGSIIQKNGSEQAIVALWKHYKAESNS